MALFNDDYSFSNILGLGSSFKGDLKINGSMHIDGDIDGNVETAGNIIIGEHARVRGNIVAKSITVGGIVMGNIIAPESVHLLSSCAVIGDIQTHRFQADKDVIIHGHCIALTDGTLYNEAVERWQNTQAIASKAILQNMRISLPAQPEGGQA